MIKREVFMDISSLVRQGYSERAIARKLGIHRRTVRKYLESQEFPQYHKVVRESQLVPFQGMIKGWLQNDDYQATKLHEMLTYQGYKGSYETVKRYVRTIKDEMTRIAYVRFETIPGQQAQVDFGEFAVICEDGKEIKLYCFVMVLGFSRHMYVEFVNRCTMPLFLDCHINAFGYFGGVPGEILYDNMKNVVIRRLVGKVKFNDTMMDFACHYQFNPLACPAYAPWCKGKVERPIDYVRERFWRGYVYWTREKTNSDVINWLTTVAFERIHGTTHQKVSDRFAVERTSLGSLPLRVYDTADKFIRKVQKDCQLSFDGNRYVFSHKCVGKKVLLKVKNGLMRIYDDAELIVTYMVSTGKGQVIEDPRFYEALRKDKEQLRMKYRKHYKGKGKATIGLVKTNNYSVQVRDIAVYEKLLEGGSSCLN